MDKKNEKGLLEELEEEIETSPTDEAALPEKKTAEPLSKEQQDKEKAEAALRDLTDINSESVKRSVSLRAILGGDILAGAWFRKQFWYMVTIVALAVFYVSNRYQSQKELIEIDHLQKQLQDVRYNELARSSELLERTRRSRVEEYLRATNDSTLQTATTSSYVLKIDEE